MLGLALLLGYLLLVWLVPRVWSAMLPGGLNQARGFRGVPGLLFNLAELAYMNLRGATLLILGAVVVAWVAGRIHPLARWGVWLVVVAVIALDAGIVVVMLQAALHATAQAAGIPLNR